MFSSGNTGFLGAFVVVVVPLKSGLDYFRTCIVFHDDYHGFRRRELTLGTNFLLIWERETMQATTTRPASKRSKGRRSHGAKCPFCKKNHGDNSIWWNKSKDGWSYSFYSEDGRQAQSAVARGWDSHNEALSLVETARLGRSCRIPN